MSAQRIASPYLVFLGNATNPLDAKTGKGLVDWCPQMCVGQLRGAGCQVDLGLADMTPAQARDAGARSLVVGVAPSGGNLVDDWIAEFVGAMQSGLDIVSGLHHRLDRHALLARMAASNGRRLVDVRVPPEDIPLATGRRRSGSRLLTVGTDCCVGKKYTALAIHRALSQNGVATTFRASGQTGILIAGQGIPVDAIVSDFVAGAAEMLSPDNVDEHWDIIEGQGSLFHPAYAAVTLGLIHGSQPDALVLCHDATRTHIDEYPDFRLPDLKTCIDSVLSAAHLTNPHARFVGVSVNTSALPAAERHAYLSQIGSELALPAIDPMINGVEALITVLKKETDT